LPIAYSAGFTPHPKISYAGAAPTGTASEAEYLELSLTEACAVGDVRDGLDAALPDGIDVIDVTEEAGSLGANAAEASQWEVVLPGVGPEQAAMAVEAFLATDTLEVERLTSKGLRRMDARAAVVNRRQTGVPWTSGTPGMRYFEWLFGTLTPAVRPDDILAALRRVADLAPSSPPLVTRLAQGPLAVMTASAAEAHVQGLAQGQIETTRPGALTVHETGTLQRARTTSSCAERRVLCGPTRPGA